jgi:hypothetical protein
MAKTRTPRATFCIADGFVIGGCPVAGSHIRCPSRLRAVSRAQHPLDDSGAPPEGHIMSTTPAQHVYGTQAPGGAALPQAIHGGATLPFTGFDAGAFAGVGLLLIVAGLALRGRRTRSAA